MGLLSLAVVSAADSHQPEFSTAGFFRLDNTGRDVRSMNPAWRFHKGGVDGAEQSAFDDSDWGAVSLPHGIEYLPTEASGCYNYQGEVWYRKHFKPDAALQGKRLFVHFEAIMGKSKVYLNGRLLKEHFGGYLPVVVEITDLVSFDSDNVLAVWADNSDDPSYAPGKAQEVLDFTYCGGIYRDCWLVSHGDVYITDPNFEDKTAGGGLFVAFGKVADDAAEVSLKLHLRNRGKGAFRGSIDYKLLDAKGRTAAESTSPVRIAAGKERTALTEITVGEPALWSPASPHLYNLEVRVNDETGRTVDGYRRRIGIRSIEFKGKEGFWLNGKPYGKPLIGANRHQDFAVVGNAVANSIHWRDAKKLKDLGLEVIRNAHCPQDPAFMDACDELGLLMIVNTPGWQFWNDEPSFAQSVYSDIRNLVRRDRNHPCVWLWEPVLNETWYPKDFARNVVRIVDEEYPYPYCYSGCDSGARGREFFPVYFAHPANMDHSPFAGGEFDESKTYFTREWGDNVDDWNSHNSTSRVARNWGEHAMLVQAQHYASSTYPMTNYDVLWQQGAQHVGGCLWHPFDHQRGYHPDPFYGGLMDAFRQPKYSYYMFMAQRPAQKSDVIAETGPMVYIAHEMTPFSEPDVKVFSNCDEVRLTYNAGGEPLVYKKDASRLGMPSPIITFENVYDFMVDKKLSRAERQEEVFLLAEGLIDGQVVATHKVEPARRPEQLLLWVDNEEVELRADGSDFVTVVAAVADKRGNIKRLNNYYISFEVEGEGRILGSERELANPAPVKWGTAPVLIQSTLNPGKILVRARVLFEGSQMPVSAELELKSVAAAVPLLYDAAEADCLALSTEGKVESTSKQVSGGDDKLEIERLRKELNRYRLRDVERQQTEFGE